MTTLSWDELAGLALARQFPELEVTTPGEVAAAVGAIGPIQSQTARSPFLGLAARFPGLTHAAITSAYDALEIVRGSTIRGTVHTCHARHHPLLEVATRRGQRGLWQRTLKLEHGTVEQAWSAIEDFARDAWRTPAELHDHLVSWVESTEGAAAPGLQTTVGTYLGFGHGGLIRRPLKGGWEGQGAPGYRTAAALLGDRTAVLTDPRAIDELVRVHLRAHGPASRHDLTWWSGLGLTVVDDALTRLDLDAVTGPDGRAYVDLPDVPLPRDVPGVSLLPEFDALMCAYHPAARLRFATTAHHDLLWSSANGLVLPPLLLDGRITGFWRASGSARKRPLVASYFPGTRRPRRAELERPVAALEAALGIEITELTIERAA